jgi:hypothetical protein
MANISDLPADLKDHARDMPDGLLAQLHQGEAEHRLRHVDNAMRAAESLSAEHYRHVTARAKRIRDAMPYADYVAEHKRLTGLKDDARNAGHHEIAGAWHEALDRLESDHEQDRSTAAVGQAIMAYDKANPQDVAKAKAAAKAAAVQKAIAEATARFRKEQDEIRKEIRELQEKIDGGQL